MVVDTSALVAILLLERDARTYALAKSRNEPLLFKGGDFALTDVLRV